MTQTVCTATPAIPTSSTTPRPPQAVHIGLATRDLEASTRFYEAFLGAPPVKQRPGYAKFYLDRPGLNLTLNQVDREVPPQSGPEHFGFQVDSTEVVHQAIERFAHAGFDLLEEKDTDCCYALQDKVWVQDPDGHRWEVFVVKGEGVVGTGEGAVQSGEEECCDRAVCCG